MEGMLGLRQADPAAHCAQSEIWCRVHNAFYTKGVCRTQAHSARFQCAKERGVEQSPVTTTTRCQAHAKQFGVRARVGAHLNLIVGGRFDLTLTAYYDGPNRHFVSFRGLSGLVHGNAHVVSIICLVCDKSATCPEKLRAEQQPSRRAVHGVYTNPKRLKIQRHLS